MHDSLDPQVAAVVEEFESLDYYPRATKTPEEARRVAEEVFGAGTGEPAVESVRDLSLEGPAGPVSVRVYRPFVDGDEPDGWPVLVYYHGGGWVLGTLDQSDDTCRELADRTGMVVVSVDYRLAPEHPFPEPLLDAYAAAEWVAANADALDCDPARVAVGGSSAGGNLAAAVALLARERGGPAIQHQLLDCPVLDCAFDTGSYERCADGPLLTREDMRWFWAQYLRHDLDGHNPFASVLRAGDVSGLPPATVVTAEFDPLRDEGAAYAGRLAAADVPVEHLDYPGMVHGFLSMTRSVDAAAAAMDDVAATLAGV